MGPSHTSFRRFLLLFVLILAAFAGPALVWADPRPGPLVEPLVEVPKQAQFVDLAGEGAKSGPRPGTSAYRMGPRRFQPEQWSSSDR